MLPRAHFGLPFRPMQEADAVALHSSLREKESARGGSHGGLGFDVATGSGKAKKTKAEKSLNSTKTSSSREFATTSAGAVAAGHWDPWARPVEFKMKEVNRKVGGLYTMFVKGGTEGGTLKELDPASASAAASSSSSSFNWKRSIREVLRAAPGGELRLKRLRQHVLAEHAKAHPEQADDAEGVRQKFKTRLKKMSDVTLEGKLVRLAPT